MASYTVDTLVESVRRRGHLTHSAGSIDTDDIVALADEEQQTYVFPFLMGLRAEFGVTDYALSVVAGTPLYDMPPRAVGTELRWVGRQGNDGQFTRMLRAEPERLVLPPQNSGQPSNYYFQDLQIGFSPCGTASILLKYFRRPGTLVLEEKGGQITAIDTGTGQVTLAAVPGAFSSSQLYDCTSAKPPFKLRAMDQAASLAGSILTFSTLPTGLAVGDWVTLATESVIPQLPVELHPFLAQRTVVKALEALGDARGEQFAKAALDEERRLSRILVDRTQGSPRYIINRHGPGFRKYGRRW